jgi:hypothetical protein
MSKLRAIASTSAVLPCSAEKAWSKVCFYEHLSIRPSWLLRTVLPVPVKTTGACDHVGGISRCVYSDGGFLTKLITRIVVGETLEFQIIEQSIRYSRWIALKGGTIQIVAHEDGTSSVHMQTRYELPSPPFLVARFFIGWVVKEMHRIVIRDMQYRLAMPERWLGRPHVTKVQVDERA